ncbi:ER membrane protein complex subunit 10 [Camellia lanceoleosa]|uniref:ER membrane protein complex subunit 10 n=1 Tax=Camellia lanceoleosa TaxID=1840588 RepID=A0ACC0J3H1_9ERIC|nr:ER membrane protein complex subunit 10 [Camellia lanceoleosa]
MGRQLWLVVLLCLGVLVSSSLGAVQSDELLVDDEEYGLDGGRSPPDLLTTSTSTSTSTSPSPFAVPISSRRRRSSDPDSDSKVQFPLEHAFGDSHFSLAGTFTARLKTSSHGSQTLTKLRFSREAFTETDKEKFEKLLEGDEFYRIRVPSNVLSPPGREYVISSVKVRCLPRDRLDEHFVIHMDGVNILTINYGSPGACPYPRQLKHPAKWSFNSHTVLKYSEQAPRTPAFAEEILGGENGEGEGLKPPEKSFLAKYWMYLVPLGLIVMNAITQAANMPEEQASGQSASQTGPAAPPPIQRGQSAALRGR